MKKWIPIAVKWLHTERDARPLAVFRMVFFSIMLMEVVGFEDIMPLLVDEVPFDSPSDWRYGHLFGVWKVVLVAVILGTPSRFWRVANWVFAFGFFNAVDLYEYHMFYAWTGVSFLSVFVDLNRSWSIESIVSNVRQARAGQPADRKVVANWDYYVILLVAVGFVYADSVLWKLTDEAWVGGLGMYRPASLPFISFDSWLTDGRDSELIFRLLGGLTLAFEALFVPLLSVMMRRKWLALLCMAIGIGLHGGIGVLFPLPLFGWGYAAFFVLLWPTGWLPIGKRVRHKYTFFYDRECPLCCQTQALLASLDWFKLIEFKPVQFLSDDDIAAMGSTRDEMLTDIGGKWKSNKTLCFGVETYCRVLLIIPVLLPLGILLNLPGIKGLARGVYGEVARRRMVNRCTFESCGIPVRQDHDVELISGVSPASLKRWLRNGVLLVCLLIQGAISWDSGVLNQPLSGLDRSIFMGQLNRVSNKVHSISKPVFGFTEHALFMSYHFDKYVEIGTFTNGDVWFPLDEFGFVNTHSGPVWAVWTWRIHSNNARKEKQRLVLRFQKYFEHEFVTELEYRVAPVPEYSNVYDPLAREKARVRFE